MHSIGPQDDHTHKPSGEESWQESWAFIWYDPLSRVAGYFHTGMQFGRGMADCWYWLSEKGKLVDRFNNNWMELPKDDYSDLRIGPIHVRSLVPNVKREVEVSTSQVKGRLVYEAFTKEALVIHAKKSSYFEEISSGGHYETMGRITGTLEIEGRSVAIDALGYDDRSWGKRNLESLHYRIACISFGPQLYCVAYYVATDSGGATFGWVSENGVIRNVVDVTFSIAVKQDGLMASGAKVQMWTEDRSGLEFEIEIDGQSVVTQRGEFMCSPGLGVARHGGRLGVGFIEFSEMKHPTPAVAKHYGLDPSDFPRHNQS